ncbi:hypothetical protein F5X68DRAFT_257731 [Plectosphaerella plurivora]|uniref:C3H1-type domain-containing protein n=1 Tax=Plectosphaerella plurivora TaxID=936078 RepID=A0A9P9AHC7_9PEZI|nr:hypothetical protein F5X68DRAFT_257731 [Plectosphaerella plurivora]
MDAFLANASDNSSSPEAASSVASRFTTPELDGPYRSGHSADKAVSVWEGRRADITSFGSAANMVDRLPFQAAGQQQHRATMSSDPRQQRWQQYQTQNQYTMASAAASPTETERSTMYTQQQYLESPSWRLPSTTRGANNTAGTSPIQSHEYNMLQWQQQLLQQQQQQNQQHNQQQHHRPPRQQQQGAVSHMDSFYAYCFDRGNGTYTRLIPADMIPPLMNVPATQLGSEGMLVLPLPLRPPPFGPLSNIEPVTVLKTPPPSPVSGSDTIQKKIDHIVATTPTPQKRPKIYCDKWVHEGVCAFTQQGCKYKHEMPLDKATQMSLGLFHGLPTWWKKQQAERQREQPDGGMGFGGGGNGDNNAGAVGGGSGGNGRPHGIASIPQNPGLTANTTDAVRTLQSVSWRRPETVTTALGSCGGTKLLESTGYHSSMGSLRSPTTVTETRGFSHQNSSPTSPCLFGPIGPPLRHNTTEGGPTSYPSSMAMNIGRSAVSRDTEMDGMVRSRMTASEKGQAEQQQRQRRSEDLARLDHLRF